MNIVILYSGGLDSKVLYEYAKINNPNDTIKLIYYDYGSPICESEKIYLPENVKVRELEWFGHSFDNLKSKSEEVYKGNIYIPGRNLVFTILAACQELPDEIWMGTLVNETHDDATDKNYTFIEKTEQVLNYVLSPFNKNIKIRFPFAENGFKKQDIIQYAINNNLTEILKHSFSCFTSTDGIACGICHSCIRTFFYFYKKIEYTFKNQLPNLYLKEYLINWSNKLSDTNYNEAVLDDLDYKNVHVFLNDYPEFLDEYYLQIIFNIPELK